MENGRIHRFDRLVDEFVSLNSFSALQRMNTEYPHATRLLIEDVLSVGSVQDALIEQRLRGYYLDSVMQTLLEDVHRMYADLSREEQELFRVFGRIKEADATFRVPMVYAQVSGLNQSIVVGDSVLGISLDKYLGRDYPLYHKYYHDYQLRQMDRGRLVPDALFYYLLHESPQPEGKRTLRDFLLTYGKIHWVIAHLRGVSLADETGVDRQQAARFGQCEGRAWKMLSGNDLLASSDTATLRRMMRLGDAAADTTGVPPGIAPWIGLRIVDSYMKSHPGTSVGDLLRMTDYAKLLGESGYQPKDN